MHMKTKTIAGGILCNAALVAGAADITVDFSKTTGRIRAELHSSGCAPRLYPRAIRNDENSAAYLVTLER